MKEARIIGMMSGSSLDGIDLATCLFAGSTPKTIVWELEKSVTIPFDPNLKERLARAPDFSSRELLKLEADFSRFCADKIQDFINDSDKTPDYLSIHGHTIFHFPEDGYTCQIGKGSVLATQTGIPCISDVRSNDVALGGSGAPIAPISEAWLFPGHAFYINLGGIANFSCHNHDRIYSMDSCPCNQVLNHLVQPLGLNYDDQGALARKGSVEPTLLQACLDLPYFKRDYPKSMDNTWVKKTFMSYFNNSPASIMDKLATMVELVAIQLTREMSQFDRDDLDKRMAMVSGGGAYNLYLMERIQHHCEKHQIKLHAPDPAIIDFKEAIMMALMGYLRVNELPNNIPTVTGANKTTCGGALYLP